MPTLPDERYEVQHEGIKRYLRTLATLIDEEAPEGWGWGLFLVKHGDNPKAAPGPSPDGAGAVFWISNSERAGMIDILQGWIDDNKKRQESRSRAAVCAGCGQPLKPYDPNDTSTWRDDDFCSARCKRRKGTP